MTAGIGVEGRVGVGGRLEDGRGEKEESEDAFGSGREIDGKSGVEASFGRGGSSGRRVIRSRYSRERSMASRGKGV